MSASCYIDAMSSKFVKSIALALCLLLGFSSPVGASSDLKVTINSSVAVGGTVTLKYLSGKVEVSAPLWTGSVPTSITGVYDKYQSCQTLNFPIQGMVSLDELKQNVTVKFEVWSSQGEKLASEQLWYSDWNPTNGPTMVTWLECDDWLVPGAHTLIVTTQQTTSTNGLMSRYLEGVQQFPFTINPVNAKSTIKCKKGRTIKTVTGRNPKCPSGYKKAS